MEKFKYVTPDLTYKDKAIDYINEFYKYNSNINGVGGLKHYLNNYEEWLIKLENDRHIIPNEKRVPAETFFLVRVNDNHICGMINIRLALNEIQRKHGGHIGYSIRPTERRKGYNKINLYLALLFCQKHQIKEVMLDCDKDNLASSHTMLALGGTLIKEYDDYEIANCEVQVYTIKVDEAIQKYHTVYEQFIINE